VNKIVSSLAAVALVAMPFCVGCQVDAPEAQVDENLTGIKLPNTSFAKYSAVFGISQDLKTPAVGKNTAVLVGAEKGDKVSVGVTCFNLVNGKVQVSLVKIASNGKSATSMVDATLTATHDSKSFDDYVLKKGDRLAVVAKTTAALPKGVSCTVGVGGLSHGLTEAYVDGVKKAYDTLTESQTDTDSPDFKAFDEKKLTGLAKRQFNYLSATWASDYPPAAYSWTVDGEDVIVITEDNDGGGSRDFYTTDGRWIVSGSYSESEPFSW
jgi:hypothetical protein